MPTLPAKEIVMKQTVATLAAAVAIAFGTAAYAVQAPQTPQTPESQKKTPPEVVLTGCVIQGSGPTVFIFDNAKKEANSAVEKGVRYLLVSTVEDVDLRAHLNHEVRIVGEVDIKVSATPATPATPPSTPPTTPPVTTPATRPVPPDPQTPADEKTLPKLTAKSVTMVSDTCSMVR
jgi:hypothetical protein